MVKARFYIEVEVELSDSDSYPDSVTNWEQAAEVEYSMLYVMHEADIELTWSRMVQSEGVVIESDKEFKR